MFELTTTVDQSSAFNASNWDFDTGNFWRTFVHAVKSLPRIWLALESSNQYTSSIDDTSIDKSLWNGLIWINYWRKDEEEKIVFTWNNNSAVDSPSAILSILISVGDEVRHVASDAPRLAVIREDFWDLHNSTKMRFL